MAAGRTPTSCSSPRPSPRLQFAGWEDRLRLFQREVQTEFCQFEAFADAQAQKLTLAESTLARREAEQRVVEEHKMQLQGLALEKLSIRELEQLETVQVAAVRRTRKRKDALVQKELARLEERVEKMEGERKCKLCHANAADHVLVPCGHRCCMPCFEQRQVAARAAGTGSACCHICHKPAPQILRIFSA